MKKKIAMLLASVMAISTMSINVFASTNNYVSKAPTNVTNATLMLEEGWVYEYVNPADQRAYAFPDELAKGAPAVTRLEDNLRTDRPAADLVGGNKYTYKPQIDAIMAGVPGPAGNYYGSNYAVDGPSLKLQVRDALHAGDTFKIELTNARWRFWNQLTTSDGIGNPNYLPSNNAAVYTQLPTNTVQRLNKMLTEANASVVNAPGVAAGPSFAPNDKATSQSALLTNIKNIWADSATIARVLNNGTELARPENFPTSLPLAGSGSVPNALPKSSYDINKGIFVPSTTLGASGIISDTVVGTYYRYGGAITPGSAQKNVPYALYVTYTNVSVAIVTILENASAGDMITIPLVVQTTGADDIRATIVESVGNFGSISSGTYLISVSGTNNASTTASISGSTPNSSGTTFTRDEFILNDIIIRENRVNSIGAGTFVLSLPNGYHFNDPATPKSGTQVVAKPDPTVVNATTSNVVIGIESGLAWGSNQTGFSGSKATIMRSGFLTTAYLNGSNLKDYFTADTVGTIVNGYTNQARVDADYAMSYYWNGYSYEDNKIVVSLNNISKSRNLTGALILRGLRIYADENAPMDTDVVISIQGGAGVSSQSLTVGKRLEYATSFAIGTPVPALINGRYSRNAANGALVGMLFAEDAIHRSARITYQEATASSWWIGRSTTFTLSTGAKFRKVKFDGQSNVANYGAINTEYYAGNSELVKASITGAGNGVYLNDGLVHGHVTINGDKMTITNLQQSTNGATAVPNKAQIHFYAWLSIQSGLEAANVTLTASGAAVEKNVTSGPIATQKSPVTVKTKVSPLRIGLQYQPAETIVIAETQAGVLQAGKEVIVTITDYTDASVLIGPQAEVSIGEGGDLKLSSASYLQGSVTQNPSTGAYTNTLFGAAASNAGGSLKFTIDRSSTKLSSIIISNVQVRVDRTVPKTNESPYHVLVWGSAIAENYGMNKDQFSVPGISAEYINITTSESDIRVSDTEVQVPIGETYYILNSEQIDMDVAAYVSEASNSTMVPVRFVANALGISDDQIIYDNDTRTATIIHPDRVVQFTADSDRMKLNGAETIMRSPDNLPVTAEIKDDRMFIPFRALGEAFGMQVSWKADPPTAVYKSVIR